MHLRTIGHFLRSYKYFSLILLSALIGLGLQLAGYAAAARWLLSSVAIITCLPLLRDMWHDLRSGTYGIDILAITAIITSVILGEYWAATVIVIMLTGGEALEDYAENRAKAELTALLDKAPQTATVIRGRKQLRVRASQVQAGDKIALKPGDIVPVDAIILEGSSNIDEAALTGESLPVSKQAGDELLSGSINADGALVARCLRPAKDSQYQQIVKLVKTATASQAPFVRMADRYAIPFTIIAFTIAGCAWLYSGDALRFLQVLVVATPCPLILAAPIAIISGMSRNAKAGIIVKTGGALERLATARSFTFDKTGTLTSGRLQVGKVHAYGKQFSQDDVLLAAASLEQHSHHVVAQAVLQAAEAAGLKLRKVKQLKETAGQGIAASFSGKAYVIGRLAYLAGQGVDTSRVTAKRTGKQPATMAYVAIGGQLAGSIELTDTLRPESGETVSSLQKLGYGHIGMVTGDNRLAAKQVAAAVGIDTANVTAEALPGDKLRAVEGLAKPAAFVGDGVNDAPVLTASDVGIAMGARGSTVASESADIVIMTDDLSKVATAAAIAKRTFAIARQSILIGVVISVVLMGVYATGRFSALSGALIQELVDVIVIINALRALRPHAE